MTTNNNTNQLNVIAERVQMILDKISVIERRLEEGERERNTFRAEYEKRHATLVAQHAELQRDLIKHETNDLPKWAAVDRMAEEMKSLAQVVTKLEQTNKLMIYVGGIVTTGVIGWIITQIMGGL